MSETTHAVLELKHVGKVFDAGKSTQFRAVQDVSLTVRPGECLGVVGESGCGKSTLARMITRLTDVSEGEILLCGRDISSLRGQALRNAYRDVQMVFQDPYSVFSPRTSVGTFLEDGLVYHGILRRREARQEARRLMELVELPAGLMERFPHQLSGGQLQRVVIARAVSIRPKLVLLDEATSALDVSVQKQILKLLVELQRQYGLTYVLIGHDLAVVRTISDRIAVMYAGMVVEELDAADLDHAMHPYTRMLLNSVFSIHDRGRKIIDLEEMRVSNGQAFADGCPYRERCMFARPVCAERRPPLVEKLSGHSVACHTILTAAERF